MKTYDDNELRAIAKKYLQEVKSKTRWNVKGVVKSERRGKTELILLSPGWSKGTELGYEVEHGGRVSPEAQEAFEACSEVQDKFKREHPDLEFGLAGGSVGEKMASKKFIKTEDGKTYKVRYEYVKDNGTRWYVLEVPENTTLYGAYGDEYPADERAKRMNKQARELVALAKEVLSWGGRLDTYDLVEHAEESLKKMSWLGIVNVTAHKERHGDGVLCNMGGDEFAIWFHPYRDAFETNVSMPSGAIPSIKNVWWHELRGKTIRSLADLDRILERFKSKMADVQQDTRHELDRLEKEDVGYV